MEIAIGSLVCLLLAQLLGSSSGESFDVRSHLSTVTRYDAVKGINSNGSVASPIPDGCSVIHLNLVARHGTRSPTKKRMKELDQLAIRLETLLSEVKQKAQVGTLSLQKIPDWLWRWQSPWKGKKKGGELIGKGEDELYHLGIRTRKRFPNLFDEDYHPDVFPIRASQVPRASASAVAFGMGLFSGKGSLGPGMHCAFAVTSESRANDIFLRFHETCETYKEYRKGQEPGVEKLKEPIFDEVSNELVARYQLNFTSQDVASLWFLCKQEASLLDITDQACSLFSPSEVALLEWTDDLELFILKGYGKSINYHMGTPLLQDVFQSMEQAVMAKEENHEAGTFEKARFQFAHAETLLPFTCLLGLFLKESEFEKIQNQQSLELPPKPPQERNWRGSTLAPFAGNIMLVVYVCGSNDSKRAVSSEVLRNGYYVQVLHNEVPVPILGCGNTDFCPFEVFKRRVVNPNLEQNFDLLCNTNFNTKIGLPVESPKPVSVISKFLKLLHWLFSRKDDSHFPKHKTEL